MTARRACQSPNHRGDRRRYVGEAVGFRCPRCQGWFCSTCEGTTDGLRTCDACAVYIYAQVGPDEARPAPHFLTLVRRYAFKGQIRRTIAIITGADV